MVNQPQQVQIRAKDDDLKGNYSNLMQVSHSQEEFVLDFFHVVGGGGVLTSRVILSPGHYKRMLGALQENLTRYEKKFGDIKVADAPPSEIGFQAQS